MSRAWGDRGHHRARGSRSRNSIGGQPICVKTSGRTVGQMMLLEPAGMKMALGENLKRV
jgi:hypothetical protein